MKRKEYRIIEATLDHTKNIEQYPDGFEEVFKAGTASDIISRLEELDSVDEYVIEEYEIDESGDFYAGSDYDTPENFIKRYNPVRDIRNYTGLSQQKFANWYNIPLRTVQNWEGNVNEPPVYLIQLLWRAVKEDFKPGA